MLSTIKNFFDAHIHAESGETADSLEHRLRVATVALLLETARADFDVHEAELDAVASHAQHFFGLDEVETKELVELAEEEASNATCYYEFTSLINSEFAESEKIHIVELMWQVAYSDQVLEKYEESLVKKIADLLYVPHSAVMAAKHRVKTVQGLD